MSSIYIEREYPDRDVESETGSQNIEGLSNFGGFLYIFALS